MKVVVAMSGGLDSSVAAALLKKRRFDVIGVFMKLADLPRFRENEKRAKRVAKVLKIPFLSLDLRKEFKKRIIDYFLKGYKKGITPNPCVVCNKEIKFGLLLEKARDLDADYIATGHYARLRREIRNPKFEILKLLKGKDKNKDQSYFLWMLNQKQLERILFPIGDYTRKEVEKLAKKFKLPVLKARKSVEICFIQTASPPVGGRGERRDFSLRTTINNFLKKYLNEKPGKICSKFHFEHLGEHRGLWFYTIGQRKGIGLPGGPYYVLNKDLRKNLLIVTKNEKDLYKKELTAQKVNWIRAPSDRLVLDRAQKICALVSGKTPKLSLKIKAKIRYRHRPATAIISRHLESKVYSLKFKVAQRAITLGQSVVFYRGEEVLGGGIICENPVVKI